ncbi:MAG: hypothetical protein ABJ215_07020 [Alphaproteobacteria bacterium]
MRTMIALSVLITARLVATAAADPAITDATGQWYCLPDDPRQPQIQIDFIEDAYRRCDQHICSIYDLSPLTQSGDHVRIAFGGVGVLEARLDGSRYVETVRVGADTIINQGGCEFRHLDDLHLEGTGASASARAKL